MNLEKGTKYLIKEELKALCCGYIFTPDEVVEIHAAPSKNRLIIANGNTFHKVKKSALNRTSKEI